MRNCRKENLFRGVKQRLKALAQLFAGLIFCEFHRGVGAGFTGCGEMHFGVIPNEARFLCPDGFDRGEESGVDPKCLRSGEFLHV